MTRNQIIKILTKRNIKGEKDMVKHEVSYTLTQTSLSDTQAVFTAPITQRYLGNEITTAMNNGTFVFAKVQLQAMMCLNLNITGYIYVTNVAANAKGDYGGTEVLNIAEDENEVLTTITINNYIGTDSVSIQMFQELINSLTELPLIYYTL